MKNLCISVFTFLSFISSEKQNEQKNLFENDSNCYWEETFNNTLTGKRGNACGSSTSLRLYYTNPYNYRVRVAFYMRDENGNLNPNGPYVIGVNPGKRINHHKCYSNGRYIVLAAKADDYCKFPQLN
ncbi:MAG: hypothetical protein ED556_04855 [Winogradskyella sp.]|uniref:hypothetical protein n=1 Tax=Winogradskyella sp. TaxID=1883156 RepID=UPI000F3C59A3|nr:hypothetical protein [Winogradskyella sp.]RNC86753.1 MAG: hypothetical protein ED556_04855 [Winogradskyella sp.]